MIVAHLSELHLGFQAYGKTERGRNVRERDVAAAFERAIAELVRIEPDLVLFVGDVFDRADPEPAALVTLTRGIETLRSSLPEVSIAFVAGARDTPLRPGDAGVLQVIESFPDVEVATGTSRSVHLRDSRIHLSMVPYRAGLREPFPSPSPDPRARWNVLAAYGGVFSTDGGTPVDPEAWSYVALGGEHVHRSPDGSVVYAGSLERVGSLPWSEAAEEKGFVIVDLTTGRRRFQTIPVRPVVALAPVRAPAGGPEALRARVRELTDEIPGGIEEKVVRLRVAGTGAAGLLGLQGELLSELGNRALHLDVESEGDPGRLPGVAEVLERHVAGDPSVEEVVRRLPEEVERAGAPWADLRSALTGEDEVLGPVDLRLPEGFVAVVGTEPAGVHRFLELLAPLPAEGPPAPWIALHRSGPTALLEEVVDRLAAAAGVGALERVLRRLDGGGDRAELGPEGTLKVADRAPAHGHRASGERGARRVVELERELRDLRADHAEVAGDVEAATMDWLRERQDAETQLQAYRDRARELKARLAQLESGEADTPCPTCGRVLGDQYEGVIEELREEWEGVVQDGSWWRRRREQLDLKPEGLQELESRAVRLQAAVEACAERLEAARNRADRAEGVEIERNGQGPADTRFRETAEEVRRDARTLLLERASRYAARITASRLLALVLDDGGGVRLEGPRSTLPGGEEDVAVAETALRLAGIALAAEEGWPADGVILPMSLTVPLMEEDRLRLLDLLPSLGDRVRHIVVAVEGGTAGRRHEVFDAVLEVRPESGGRSLHRLPCGRSRILLDRSIPRKR